MELYQEMLLEIGSRAEIPPNAKFQITEHKGSVQFDFMSTVYNIDIRLPIKQGNVATLAIDFDVVGNDYKMTNQGQMLKVMSYVVGSLEEWIARYQAKFEPLQIIYIQYHPKSEESETQTDDGKNARDRVYKIYIEKFAKRHGSETAFSTSGGSTIAKFNPKLEIK